MTTSPPRLFMPQMNPGGSTPGASDESSVGTRASSAAFSLISGSDDRLTATDHPVRIPRSVVLNNDPTWSDPNPAGIGIHSYYTDESPTPAARVGIFGQRPSLLGRLNFANDYAQDDVQSNKSGDSNATDVQSQIMPLYDASGTTDLYSKPSPAPSAHEETIKPPRVRGRIPSFTAPGIVRSESYTQPQANLPIPVPRVQQGLPTPHGIGHMGGNVASYSNVNMLNMALATASGHVGATPGFVGIHAPQPIAASQAAVLGSPIAMARPTPVQFRPGTALSTFSNVSNVSNGNVAINFPARAQSMGGQSQQLTRLLSAFDGVPTATKMLDAEYFPFVETAREGGGSVNYGVIKITNVSRSTKLDSILADRLALRCPSRSAETRSLLSLAGTRVLFMTTWSPFTLSCVASPGRLLTFSSSCRPRPMLPVLLIVTLTIAPQVGPASWAIARSTFIYRTKLA